MNSVTLGRVFYEYLEINNAKLFTVICLPQGDGRFPTVICRNPYVDAAEQGTEEDICKAKLYEYKGWLDNGYAVVFQHCRGRGKSTGDYIPGDELEMTFSFDEHAFVIQKGEKLRIDISSSAFPHYVRHTNNKGLFSEQTTAKIAYNTVVLDESYIEIPIA